MKKITFVLGSMTRGGAERVVSILANYYAQNGYHIDIILLLNSSCDYDIDPEVKIIDFTMPQHGRLKNIPRWIKRIRSYLRKEQTDCVIAFAGRINALTLLANTGIGKKVIISERNDPQHDGRSKLMLQICRILYPGAKWAVYQNEYQRAYLHARGNSVIIPNPLNDIERKEIKKEKLVIAVGRLSKQKNNEMLIKAFSKIAEQYGEYRLEIYGDGYLKKQLRDLIYSLGMENKIYLKGNVKDIHEYMQRAEIYVLPSDYEGMSNALLEAQALQLPCITTNWNGVENIIINNKNGLIVPVQNEEALSNAMIKLIADKDFAAELGKEAGRMAKRYDIKNVIQIWNKIILE